MREMRRAVLGRPRPVPVVPSRAFGRRVARGVPAQRGAQVGRHRAGGAGVRHGGVLAGDAVLGSSAPASGRHRGHSLRRPRGELPVRAQHPHAHARLPARRGALLPRAAGHRRHLVPRFAQPGGHHLRHTRHLPGGARVRRRAAGGVPRHVRLGLREVPAVRRGAGPHPAGAAGAGAHYVGRPLARERAHRQRVPAWARGIRAQAEPGTQRAGHTESPCSATNWLACTRRSNSAALRPMLPAFTS